MKILGLKAYPSGYTGFLEEADHYVFFSLSAQRLIKLQVYDKSEFNGYAHFISLMSKFFPLNHFYRRPLMVERLTMSELDRIAARSTDDRCDGLGG